MLNQIVSHVEGTIPQGAIVKSSPNSHIDRQWLEYFDISEALMATAAHIAGLSGTKNTPEQHTKRAYESGLKYFLRWAQGELPTAIVATTNIPYSTNYY